MCTDFHSEGVPAQIKLKGIQMFPQTRDPALSPQENRAVPRLPHDCSLQPILHLKY